MTWNRKNLEIISAICIVTILTGQIYISPFSSWFRLSLAVITVSMSLIYFKEVPVTAVTTIIAVSIIFFRAFVDYTAFHNMSFLNYLLSYSPVAIFYLSYGILFIALDVRKKLDNPIMFILSLWICDSMGNIAEAVLRSVWERINFDKAVLVIIIIGFFRSIATYFAYFLSQYYKNRYEREQSQNKYKQLLLFIAKLKTELFFLRKSMVDIEDTMQRSYILYEKLQEPDLKGQALLVSKNIHEIKKDYQRVVAGMEKTLSEENIKMPMSLKVVFSIISDNTQNLIGATNKDIALEFITKHDFIVSNPYPLISILNNLIINSIEAIKSTGKIIVEEEREGDNYIFRIVDNGAGIEEENIDIVFSPGFSTKYDLVTGKMSTGIGLSHVKHIIENHYNGSIKITSVSGRYTAFQVSIPCKKIESGD